MEYTILILLLPLLSFLFLGLAGMKLKPVVAGAIGTAVLAVVALLSYCTAFEYFSAGRDASGDRKSTRLNSSHPTTSRMPSSA